MKRPENKQEEQDWIERYLNNKMSAEESLLFTTALATDQAFAQDVETVKRTHTVLQEAFLAQGALDTIRSLQQSKTVKVRTLQNVFRSSAGLAAACIVFVTYLSLSPVQFPDSENDFTVTRNLDQHNRSNKQQYVFDQFFDGQAHILEGDYMMAVKNFEEVLKSPTIRPYFREAAEWHLAVAYLKSGQPNRAHHIYEQFDDCLDCEYRIGNLNRWKIWWQIQWAKWLA